MYCFLASMLTQDKFISYSSSLLDDVMQSLQVCLRPVLYVLRQPGERFAHLAMEWVPEVNNRKRMRASVCARVCTYACVRAWMFTVDT